ncbi:MAG: hypothetical protein ABR612_11175 [Chromatocurvus sp.]
MLSPYHPLQLVFGLTIWTLWFVVMYGVLSVACSVKPPLVTSGAGTWINVALLVASLATAGLLLNLARTCRRATQIGADSDNPPRQFIIWLALRLHLVAAVSTIVVGLMVLFFPPCL